MPGTDGQPRWLSPDEQQAWRATVHLSQLLMRQLDRDLNAHGLSGHDYEILVELSEAPDQRLRMTELADATSQSRSRLSHQISRMENRGLVRRDECEGDKRGTFAVLTAEGIAAIERVAPDHVENVRRHFIDRLSPRQSTGCRRASSRRSGTPSRPSSSTSARSATATSEGSTPARARSGSLTGLRNRRDITRRVSGRKAHPPPATPVTESDIVGRNTRYTGGKGPQ